MNHSAAKSTLPVAIILLAITGYLYYQQTTFISHSKSAQGTVIENISHLSMNDDSHVYAPLISFRTDSGQEIQYESGNQTSPAAYKIGDRVDVFYDPASPNNVQINNPIDIWLSSWICGGIALIFLILTGIFYFVNP